MRIMGDECQDDTMKLSLWKHECEQPIGELMFISTIAVFPLKLVRSVKIHSGYMLVINEMLTTHPPQAKDLFLN